MTVHRAQGQSLQFLEVDCYSFFSPGQMGVAVGRVMTIDGLRIINYNSIAKAAKLKHRSEVYDFYYHESLRPMQNLECCKSLYEIGINENVVVFEEGMDNLVFSCPVCQSTILENPKTYKDQSIGCDFCNEWYHYKCISLKGNENCLTKKKL